jgi:hypothetical protein
MTSVFTSATDVVVFVVIVLGRLLLPLLIPRFPLPAIIGCLVLDGIDQTVLAGLTNIPLDNYQSYDKALDIYYGSIAFVSTMRNWRNRPAYLIGAILYLYRLIGVVLFEAFPPSGARWVLLIFPNTFEFYFIAVEAILVVWAIQRLSPRFLVWLAIALWVVVKLPQEYWIHIAQLDMTNTIRDHPWVALIIAAFVVGVGLIGWFVVRPRTPRADHPPRLVAPGTVTSGLSPVRIRSWLFAMKVIMLALLIFIFGSILPGVQLSLAQSTAWVVGLVLLDVGASTVLSQLWLRRPLLIEFGILTVLNLGFVLGLLIMTGRRPSTAPAGWLSFAAPLFFVLLVTLITVLIDRYQPAQQAEDVGPAVRPPHESTGSPEHGVDLRPGSPVSG